MADGQLAKAIAEDLAHSEVLSANAEVAKVRAENVSLRNQLKAAMKQAEAAQERADALIAIRDIPQSVLKTKPKKKAIRHPGTAMLMMSDVHCEEEVRPENVNGDNKYTLAVCEQRLDELEERFYLNLEHERRMTDIDRIVLWLGGDFITGHIHPDCIEVAQLSPMNATRWIQERLRGMIDRLSENAANVIVCTNPGNHGRSTEKNRISTELDHSWEQLMYLNMASQETKKNVHWQIAEGHLGFLNLDDFWIRHLHGHSIKYQGGVLGLALPAAKAIQAWDAQHRKVDLTIFGHWHTWGWVRGARYISNGSMIGHSALVIHAKVPGHERPCQGFAVIDHGRNEVTRAYPLFCDRDLREAKK